MHGPGIDSRAPAPALLWTAAISSAADRHTIEALGMPSAVLMERAGLCVSAEVERLLDARTLAHTLVLVGPGNNGGDGLAVARQLHGRGRAVRAVMVTARHNAAVAEQLGRARSHGVELLDALPERLDGSTLVVDGLLGTGSRGAPRGAVKDAIAWLHGAEAKVVVAIDLPSGVDVDSGAVAGLVVRADATVTFQRSKPGLHLTPARAHVGELVVADIGLVSAEPQPPPPAERLMLIDPVEVAAQLRALPRAAHKGRRGHVGVIGGTGGTPGAAILAATAALRGGAGLATLAPTDPALRAALVETRPELMLAPAEQAWRIEAADVLVVGPGLVDADLDALARLRLEDARPMVWDAGGLDHYEPAASSARHVLTPHPGEAARLLARLDRGSERAWDSAMVQSNRRLAAERLAALSGAIVVLKGAGTIVSGAARGLAISTTGGPALATAGTGDVLAGIIGALLARGLEPWSAACVGVHVHGLAGERCARDGTVALDVADALSPALADAGEGRHPPRWPAHRRG